ncbi:hypothetical protein MIND_01196400 [Mycena indigotica]|uniref:Uncharacterized protein n=1 Tax=Mycena indigotica TaxID=2126181 RepID=A0A8H6S5V6_9AGAR|nr:uncharacterized protein MIND_01196400 [Mycena indigotica]KAF7292972.1 hypothetical protein MIND_01196400 [Mycena indigotica]
MSSSTPISPPIRPRALRPLDYDLIKQRRKIRNEKARIHMAQKRADLKKKPLEVQQQAAKLARQYRARYQERYRQAMEQGQKHDRKTIFEQRCGEVAYIEYMLRHGRIQRPVGRWAKTSNGEQSSTSDDLPPAASSPNYSHHRHWCKPTRIISLGDHL